MRIVFLGTSHGVPEPNRRCSCTLLEVAGQRYIIDMGNDAINQLITRGIAPEAISCIFITHMHGDHTNGLLSFLDLCSWKFQTAQPKIFLPQPLEQTVEAIREWLLCNGCQMRPFAFHPVEEGCVYEDAHIRVTAFRTQHTQQSFAYLVEAEGKRILFSGDLTFNAPEKDFPRQVLDAPLDLAICESAHFDATAYLPMFRDCPNLKRLCINHYSDKHLASILEMPAALPHIPVSRATDGMEIDL